MRVVETGQDELPAKVDHLRLRTFQFKKISTIANREYAISAHRDRLGALNRAEPRGHHDARIHISVHEDDIGLGLGGLLLRIHHTDCSQQSDRRSNVHSPTPASASIVSRILFKPSSRPLQSNHSCNVCAPPPEPPPPIATASRPIDKGMLASVEARCTCATFPSCASTARTTCSIRALGSSSPAGRSPIVTTSH